MFEKVRAADARFQDMMVNLYTDFKIDQGYDNDEIVGKTRSLKGVMEPFSTQGNLDLLKRAGFVDMMTVQKLKLGLVMHIILPRGMTAGLSVTSNV